MRIISNANIISCKRLSLFAIANCLSRLCTDLLNASRHNYCHCIFHHPVPNFFESSCARTISCANINISMQSTLYLRRASRLVAVASSYQSNIPAIATCLTRPRTLCTKSGDDIIERGEKKKPNGFLSRLLASPDGQRNPFLAALGYYSAESRAIGAGNNLYRQALQRSQAVAAAETEDPDGFAPKYEMLSVHIYLTLRRLRAERGTPHEAEVKTAMQCLFDVFWIDVRERMLMKERGMKLLESGKWIKECEQRFFGMALAFDEVWGNDDMMRDSIRRNVTSLEGKNEKVERFRRYMATEHIRLENLTLEQIWEGVCWDQRYPKSQSV